MMGLKNVYQCQLCKMTVIVNAEEEQPEKCPKLANTNAFKAGMTPRCGGILKKINSFKDERKRGIR